MEIKILEYNFKRGYLIGSLEVKINGRSSHIRFGMPLVRGTKEWILLDCSFNGPLRGLVYDFLDSAFPRVKKSFLRLFKGSTYKELHTFIESLLREEILDKGQARRLHQLIKKFENDEVSLNEALEMLIESYER